MVCYQVNTISVEFKVRNLELLQEAIKQVFGSEGKIIELDNLYINSSTYIDMKNGTITYPDFYRNKVNELKRAYAMKAVERAAKRKRFIFKKNGMEMQLRRF